MNSAEKPSYRRALAAHIERFEWQPDRELSTALSENDHNWIVCFRDAAGRAATWAVHEGAEPMHLGPRFTPDLLELLRSYMKARYALDALEILVRVQHREVAIELVNAGLTRRQAGAALGVSGPRLQEILYGGKTKSEHYRGCE